MVIEEKGKITRLYRGGCAFIRKDFCVKMIKQAWNGEQFKTHSRYFRENTFKRLKGGNKELLIVPGANHTDLYDNLKAIPFDKIETFFRKAFHAE